MALICEVINLCLHRKKSLFHIKDETSDPYVDQVAASGSHDFPKLIHLSTIRQGNYKADVLVDGDDRSEIFLSPVQSIF